MFCAARAYFPVVFVLFCILHSLSHVRYVGLIKQNCSTQNLRNYFKDGYAEGNV
jgi:hypothetical protein